MFANVIYTANGAFSAILDDIASRLEKDDGDALFGDENNKHLVAHIFSNHCPNISSAMKTLITSFINRYEEELGMWR